MHRIIYPIALMLATAACGGAEPAPVNETALYGTPDTDSVSDAAPSSPEVSPESETERAQSDRIRRADLDRVLALGPGGMLAMVETEPVRSNGHFQGFRILRFVHGAPAAVDLKVGDVLRRVNGRSIASPDDFFAVYQALQTAEALSFELIRNGAPLTAAYPIVE